MNEQYSPTGFRVLPTVVKHLLIINVLMFLATFTLERFNIDLTDILGLHFFKATDFRVYQLITYMFMHANFGHLFFNMFALWMFGNTLENIWGSQRFLLFYMVCGIGAGLCQELVQYIQYTTVLADYATVNTGGQIIPMSSYLNMMNTVGASGAIYGLLLAFGMMFPNSMIYLYFLFPIKAKWFVIGYAVIELFSGLGGVDNVAHFAHLGGMLFGLLLILYWRKHGMNGPNFDLSKWKGWFWSMKEKFSNRRTKYTRYEEVKDEVPRNDGEYNCQRAEKERNMDAILDKISKSGYGSLTEEEKEFLFKNSK
ncbi:MAG: rhomboid family intramembrane serine protease [Bacteroidales bacterium]|nr:rhomboid family intramembrane serine protease [Bacteroidales bacterium]